MNAIAICSTKDMPRIEWLSHRKKGIGGSDVGAIMGFNKYRNILDVYVEKTTDMIMEEESESAYWGTTLENVVAKEFEKQTGKKVRRRNTILQHPKYPFMLANIDREIVGERAILECKTANFFAGKEWLDDEIPASYILQVQHYLAVTGYEKAYFAVLIGGQRFIYKEIGRDDELIKEIIDCEKDFWTNYVVPRKIPPVSASLTEKSVNRVFTSDNGESVQLDGELNEDFVLLAELKDTIKELTIQKENIETKIKFILGDNVQGYTDKYVATWKNQSRRSVDMDKLKSEYADVYKECLKVWDSRVLRIKEVK